MPNNPSSPASRSVEGEIASAFKNARENVAQRAESYRGYVTEQPGTSLLYAVGIGYLLRSLPIFGLIGVIFSIITSLLRPAALIYGAAKLYQVVQNRQKD